MADEESNQSVEGPASVARLIIEAQHDLSSEQAEYMAKMEAYFGEPGHDQ